MSDGLTIVFARVFFVMEDIVLYGYACFLSFFTISLHLKLIFMPKDSLTHEVYSKFHLQMPFIAQVSQKGINVSKREMI